MILRALTPDDLPTVHELNESEVPHVGTETIEALAAIVELAVAAWAFDDAGVLAGFVLTLPPGTAYDSLNYRWFDAGTPDFWYVDRIVIAATHRRQGLASRFYDELRAQAPPTVRRICLEVNVEPPNPVSMAFHEGYGFRTLDHLRHPDGHVVALMACAVEPR